MYTHAQLVRDPSSLRFLIAWDNFWVLLAKCVLLYAPLCLCPCIKAAGAEACPAPQTLPESLKVHSAGTSCGPGYKGPACGLCNEGYTLSLFISTCSECAANSLDYTVPGVLSSVLVRVVLLYAFSWRPFVEAFELKVVGWVKSKLPTSRLSQTKGTLQKMAEKVASFQDVAKVVVTFFQGHTCIPPYMLHTLI